VALDLAQQALSRQVQQADTLNTKAGFILGSASLLTGVLTAWRVPHPSLVSVLGLPAVNVGWLPVAAVGTYFLVVVTSFTAYRLQNYNLAPDPRVLREKYLTRDAQETQRAAFKASTLAFEANLRTIGRKIAWTWTAFGCLILEAAIVALILLVESGL
jgi:hypothetical protein